MAEQVEEWRVIADYDMYEVSNMGNVRKTYKNGKVKILKPGTCKGYKYINLYSNGNAKTFSVHRLVALTFIELVAGKLTVDHINRDKKNNNVENLRWADRYDQQRNRCNYRADILETDPKLRQAILNKEHREANKEALKVKYREYYDANKEALKVKYREYYEANKDAISAKAIEYREANKDAISAKASEKILCECGASISRSGISEHRKTDKHTKRLLDNLIEN